MTVFIVCFTCLVVTNILMLILVSVLIKTEHAQAKTINNAYDDIVNLYKYIVYFYDESESSIKQIQALQKFNSESFNMFNNLYCDQTEIREAIIKLSERFGE